VRIVTNVIIGSQEISLLTSGAASEL
jgi:hypothetical protein